MYKKLVFSILISFLIFSLIPLTKASSDSELVTVIVQLKSPSYSEYLSLKKDLLMSNFSKNAYLNILEKEHKNFLFSISKEKIYFKERWHYYLSYNGISGEIFKEDIEKLKKNPYVKGVYLSKTHYLNTDIFVPLINAPKVWQMNDQNGLSVTGKGMLIGIIDTGIDYNHPDLGGGIGKDFKVKGGYDFADKDSDPMDPPDAGHGTAVAGIAAGNGKVKGVAPDANLMAYKVFPDGGEGASEADIIAAIDQALKDGCTSVNLSLGSTGGKSEGDPETDAMNNAVNMGLIVVAAAGNDGLRSKEQPWPISAPSTAKNAISVAASDEGGGTVNIKYPSGYEDKFIPFVYGDGVPEFPEGKEYELVYCGYGREKDFEGKDLKGKLALIQRGPLAPESALLFETKYFNALANGAEGVVVFNTAPGPNVTMALNVQNHPGVELKPAVFIMEEDGYLLKSLIESGVRVSFTRKLRKENLVADFSSQGPTPDDVFKPEVAAPGTNTFTTAPQNQYTYGFGGTSGATPFVCGSTALLKQLHPDWTPFDIKSSLMTNAFILINPNNNLPFSWTDQGSGRVDVYSSATTPILINPYSIFIKDKEGELSLTVRNVSDKDLKFSVVSNLISFVQGINFDYLNKEESFTVKSGEEIKIPFKYSVDEKVSDGYYDAIIYFKLQDRTLHIPIIIKKGIPKVPTKILDEISIDPRKISPNGDGVEDTIKFHFKLNYGAKGLRNDQSYRSRITGVIIDVLDEKGTTKLGTIYKKVLMNGVYDFIWDGRDFEGKFFLSNGRYQYKIYCVTIESGDKLQLIEEGVKTGYFTVEGVVFPSTKIETRDSVPKNTEFLFDVGVKAAPDIKMINSEINFDPEYLDVIDVLPSDFIKENASDVKVEYSVNKDIGSIKIKVTRIADKGVTGEGIVFRIKFKTLKDGGTRIAVTSFTGYDSQNRPIEFLLIEKVIKITLLMGDINDDGKVDSEDLIIFAQSFGTQLGDPNYNEKCDLNGDGKVDAEDLLLLAQNFGTEAP
ncbi:MAG: S8 family serine peptidase [Caldisericia bacterium]|nr:S8 family serine peptidase [Caldisericia bacterium]